MDIDEAQTHLTDARLQVGESVPLLVRALLLVIGLCLVLPGTASAAYIWRPGPFQPQTLLYQAQPREANRLTVMWTDDGVQFTELGGEISAAEDCTRQAPNTVTCTGTDVTVMLEDGQDTAFLTRIPDGGFVADTGFVTMSGGEGDDRLETGAESSRQLSDVLDGGRDDDTLVGGPGPTTLYAGGGLDRMADRGGTNAFDDGDNGEFYAPFDSDVLAGGPGRDRVNSYVRRDQPVRLDLEAGIAGIKGERDRLTGFENASGGMGDDILLGSAGANELDGERGDDTLEGGDGPDILTAGDGLDLLRGGRGPDALYGNGGDNLDGGQENDKITAAGTDRLKCGRGFDRVRPQSLRRVPPGCERVFDEYSFFEIARRAAPVNRAGQTGFEVQCIKGSYAAVRSCEMTFEIQYASRRVGWDYDYVESDQRSALVRVGLNRHARQLLRRHGGRLTVTITARNGSQYPGVSWEAVLRTEK